MARERTQSGKLGEWNRLAVAMRANSADFLHLELHIARLEALLARGVDLAREREAFRASKQEKTQQLRAVLAKGTGLSTFLRIAVKQHYGPTSEKLTEFGLQPFRGRKALKPKPSPEAPAGPVIGGRRVDSQSCSAAGACQCASTASRSCEDLQFLGGCQPVALPVGVLPMIRSPSLLK